MREGHPDYMRQISPSLWRSGRSSRLAGWDQVPSSIKGCARTYKLRARMRDLLNSSQIYGGTLGGSLPGGKQPVVRSWITKIVCTGHVTYIGEEMSPLTMPRNGEFKVLWFC